MKTPNWSKPASNPESQDQLAGSSASLAGSNRKEAELMQ
jgi:hypothetical protein